MYNGNKQVIERVLESCKNFNSCILETEYIFLTNPLSDLFLKKLTLVTFFQPAICQKRKMTKLSRKLKTAR